MYVNVFFIQYSAVSLTHVREWCFIRTIYYYYHDMYFCSRFGEFVDKIGDGYVINA